MMTAKEFVDSAVNIAENYKTLYVMGCFGSPMTSSNKTRYTNNHKFNRSPERVKMIQSATPDTFGFDCVCLIKGILWGWNGNASKIYGGAVYNANDIPDYDANRMIKECKNVSADFSKIIPGAVVWMNDHIGIYAGDGLVVESSPKWENGVQITGLKNVGSNKSVKNSRTWSKWGLLPYISYEEGDEMTEDQVRKIIREEIQSFFSESDKTDAAETWEKTWIDLSKKYGITADGSRPRGYITRVEAMTMATKAFLKAKGIEL